MEVTITIPTWLLWVIGIVEADDYLTTNPKTKGEAIEAAIKYSLENLV